MATDYSDRISVVPLSSSKKIPGYYLHYETTASFQILSNYPSFMISTLVNSYLRMLYNFVTGNVVKQPLKNNLQSVRVIILATVNKKDIIFWVMNHEV